MASITELIVPRTQVRLSPYIKLLTIRGGYDGLGDAPTGAGAYTEIGAIQSIDIDNKREAYIWRALDVDNMGLIQGTYAGLATYDLVINRLVLYRANALEELGFFGEDIMNQTSPLAIKLELYSPSGTLPLGPNGQTVGDATRSDMRTPMYQAINNGTRPSANTTMNVVGARRAWLLTGVWFKNNPMKFDINGDLKIEQSINAIAQNMVSV